MAEKEKGDVMDQEQMTGIFAKDGALLDGHFVLASGRHAGKYADKDRIYPHPKDTSLLCLEVAKRIWMDGVEIVVAPEKGGIILSQWVAFHLCELTNQEVLAYYAEKAEGGGFVIKRGGAAEKIPGKKVAVVEDIFTTGGSVEKVVQVVRGMGGDVVVVYGLLNRGDVTREAVGNPPQFGALIEMKIDSWTEAKCPLYANGVPINTNVGKGREFLQGRAAISQS